MTPGLDITASIVITAFIDHYKAASGPHTNILGRYLRRYATTRLPSDMGPVRPFTAQPVNGLCAYFNRENREHPELGSRRDLDALISESRKSHGAGHERLPHGVIIDIIGAEYFEIVKQLIADGPEISSARVNALLRDLLEESAPVTSRRKSGGKPSDGSVNELKRVANHLWTTLVFLHQSGRYQELAAWTWQPSIDKSLRGVEEATDKIIPSWSQVRLARKRLDDQVLALLGIGSHEEELEAIASLSPKKLAYCERLLLLRAELAILANTGARITSVLEARLEHFEDLRDLGIWEHFPQKTVDAETSYPKSLHPRTMQVIESYLAVRYRRRGITRCPEHPLFVSPKVCTTHPAEMKKLSYSSAKDHIREVLDGPHTPHTVRAAVAQAILSRQGLRAFAIHDFDYEPLMIAEVQLDHKKIPGDLFGYNGYASRTSRITILERTGLIIGDLYWTDTGARHVKDVVEFERCLEARKAVSEQIEFLQQERRSLAPTNRARTVSAKYHTITDEMDSLRDTREDIEKKLAALKFDPEYEVPIPDDIERPPRVNLKQVEKDFLRRSGDAVAELYPRARDWLTIKEFADLVGISVKTVLRMIDPSLREATTGMRTRKRREYWDPTRPPIDSELGAKHRRILVDEIHPSAFAAPEQATALNRLLAGPPQEQWGPTCMTTPCIPDYRRSVGDDSAAA
jgi:hypothetical protein